MAKKSQVQKVISKLDPTIQCQEEKYRLINNFPDFYTPSKADFIRYSNIILN
jgi:hypothetical protein